MVEHSEMDRNAIGCRDLVAGLVDSGVTRAFISPGSRNTPLTLAFAASSHVVDISIRDERSAGFAALGWAKATGRPAAVVCTSGSATTHYFPAIVEADQAAIPLIVLTADRPLRLRGTSAPQTMDQSNLYGTHVKAFIDLDIGHDALRETGTAIAITAMAGIPGPVHVNIPLDEPLTPGAMVPPLDAGPTVAPTDEDLRQPAWTEPLHDLLNHRKVLIVAGGGHPRGFVEHLGNFAQTAGAPLLADPQCRPAGKATIASADVMASIGIFDILDPDIVVRFGSLPTSRAVSKWLADSGVAQVLVNRSRLSDPIGSVKTVIDAEPASAVRHPPRFTADPEYLGSWRRADDLVRHAIDRAIGTDTISEPMIARDVMASLESNTVVFVGSSMPIRDVDSYAAPRGDVRVIANRGVNGIDGAISTALGCALTGQPTTALIGDVTMLHDVTALSEVVRTQAPLRIVAVNNDGGGIFSFLPQKRSGAIPEDIYERHWGTPHGLSMSRIAAAMDMPSTVVGTPADLRAALEDRTSPSLVEVHSDREANTAAHEAIRAAALEALNLF